MKNFNPDLPLFAIEVEKILQEASVLVRQAYFTAGPVAYEGTASSPVTAADRATDQFLKGRLGQLFPEAGWLSEETVDNPARLECEWVWVVDPIDGTREFVKKVPEFTISIGLAQNGRAVLGGIINPVTLECGVGIVPTLEARFSGFPTSARRNAGSPLALENALVSVSRRELETGVIQNYAHLIPRPLPLGSVAYKLLRVAASVEDLTLSADPKSEWDICGGVALLQAVGRDYRRLDGKAVIFNKPRPLIQSGSLAGLPDLMDQFQRG